MTKKPLNILTREKLVASPLKTEVVSVPEWGGDVMIREFTGKEKDDWEVDLENARSGGEGVMTYRCVRARAAVMCLINEDGTRMFSDDEINVVGDMSAAGLDRVFDRIVKVSGMRKDSKDAAKKK